MELRTWYPAAGVTLAVLLLLAGGAAGCATRQSGVSEALQVRPVWPPPPDAARVEYIQAFSIPEDLGIRRKWVMRVLSRIAYGKTHRGMARPYDVAVNGSGIIAVADPDGRSLHLFDEAGSRYRRVMDADGLPMVSPVAVVADKQGRFYVSDSVRGAVFRFASDGSWETAIGSGGLLERPTGLAYDNSRGLLWVVDTAGHCLVAFDGRGDRVRKVGHRGSGRGEFNFPVAVALDRDGRMFVTDAMNFRIQVLDASGTPLYDFGRAGKGPGDLDKAKGVAVDSAGHVYVVEGLHDVIQVYDDRGQLLTVIGGTGDGPGEFGLPAGIHIDDSDRIFIADSANHRIQILKYIGGPDAAGVSR
jgi:DNA-binding beta-propeller fold protein YncE